jgi:PAS domain S-box-containing protein
MRHRVAVGVILVSIVFIALQLNYLEATIEVEVTSVLGEGFVALLLMLGLFIVRRLQGERDIYMLLTFGLIVLYFYALTDVLDELLKQPDYFTYIFEDFFQVLGIGLVIFGMMKWITRRELVQEALRKSEERLRILVGNAPIGLNVIAKDGTYEYVNPKFVEIFGYTLEDVPTGKKWFDKAYPDAEYRQEVIACWIEDLREAKVGATRPRVFTVICKDGSKKEILFRPATLTDGRQLVTYEDITERKREEEEINQAAEEWETTFNSIEDLVSIQDKDFKLVRVNKAYADVFNMKPKGLIGKICYEIIHGTKEPPPNCPHKQTLGTRKSIREEFFEPRLGIHCEVSASPIFNKKDEIAGTVHIVKDITKRKRAEEELRRKNEELESFIYTISHDLKTPLITVQGFVSALEEDCGERLGEEARRHLRFIRDASKKMEALVKDLLELSRIGRVVHPKEEVDFSQVVEESVKGFKKRIKKRRIELVVADEFPVVACDKQRMMQVMENLLSNAIKFMGDNPSPRIEVGHREEEDGFHRFWVKDNGIGIDPQYHGKIFELFQSLGEVEDEEGTGVGLTIVRRVIEQQGGRVWLESAEGQGSTFYLTLPKM